jgi:phosphate transport system substrate-binding protein
MFFAKKYYLSYIVLIASTLFFSCSGTKKNEKEAESTTNGTVHISVDKSLKPVIEQEIKVFDSSFPKVQVNVVYTDESSCIQDLFKDSSRLIVTTRNLTESEREMAHKNGMVVHALPVAQDAIALIVAPSSPDSFMTMGQLKAILTGKFSRPYTIVFDDSRSGARRYISDSLIPGQELSSKTYAVMGDEAVIKYVAEHEDALGILGVSQVYDPQDDNGGVGQFRKNIRVVALKDTVSGDFFQPYQAYIYFNQYPLTRNIYFINRENWPGPASGFANFLCSQQGQLIFKKARLVPLRVQLRIRPATIK